MKIKVLTIAALAVGMMACGSEAENTEAEGEKENKQEQVKEEQPVKEDVVQIEEVVEEPAVVAAINNQDLQVEGSIQCVKEQYALVKEGKFEEALNYYTSEVRAKVQAEIDANPAITEQWQSAISSIPEDKMQEVFESIAAAPDFFVFEEGMWRMNQK